MNQRSTRTWGRQERPHPWAQDEYDSRGQWE
jgi:hypothetical protein